MGIFVCIPKVEAKEVETILHNGGYNDLTWCYDPSKISEALNLGKSSLKSPITDLVLLDISSDRESIKQCKIIKESRIYNEVPVIILSENNSQETFQMAFAYGASDFILKPIRNFELLTRVRSALKMKHEIDRRKSRERELLEVTRQLSDLNTVLNRLSLIDSLTGVPNRRCFDQSLDQELRLSVRNACSLSLILIDIDCFKLYNDSYGHQAGDECLKSIAQCISLCLRRPSDLIARYGGEEFAAVLPDTDRSGAEFISQKLANAIQRAKIVHDSSKVSDLVTVSQGIATFNPGMQISSSELIACADKALYDAKSGGRNSVKFYEFNSNNQDDASPGKAS